MDNNILKNYESLEYQYNSLVNKKKQELKVISFARLLSFILIIPAYYYLDKIIGSYALGISLILLSFFLFLVKKYISFEKLLNRFKILAEINKNEILAIKHEYRSFDSGQEFTDHHHEYSFDLDFYGEGSLFQFLNRTGTKKGKYFLSQSLNNSFRSKSTIEKLQQSIQELSIEIGWRQILQAIGNESKNQNNNNNSDEIIYQRINLNSKKLLNYLTIIVPSITILMIALSIFGFVSAIFYVIPVICQWLIFTIYIKKINRFQNQFDSQSKIINSYSELLFHIENIKFSSPHLYELQNKLRVGNKTAGEITEELKKILNEFEYRQNIIVGVILNSVFLWDIRCILKMFKWQDKHANKLTDWLSVIAEFDALSSFANLNYNHPEWVMPKAVNSEYHLLAEDLGHPLITENKCITNSFDLTNNEQFVIITGANMAGKSTFLRTIGINMVLASNGSKVFASKFEFSPTKVYTNMRTSDNLMNDESYFYAELLRLQKMLNLIKNGDKLFIIIDEMLRGTNSTDKLNGSIELIKQLIKLKTRGIVATHDLNLTELSGLFPQIIKNQCFEVLLENNELSFDYKLSAGVTQTMNATFLMKKMGIIPKNN